MGTRRNRLKINNIKKRLLKEAQEKLFADPKIESIPASEEGLLNLYFAQQDYKNRQARDVENNLIQD